MIAAGYILAGRYVIERQLGSGGFGIVYLATDNRLSVKVAIKVNALGDNHSQQVFQQEAKMLATFDHPNLPNVTDYFIESQGQYKGQYLVMKYIPGENLHDKLMREGALDETNAIDIILLVLYALDYLHDRGVYHRDIKPKNILITPKNQVFLVDFGLAKDSTVVTQTMRGAQAYSNGYSPIEQYSLTGTSAASDLYSVGATLYSLLTSHTPLEAPQRVISDKIRPINHFQSISPDLDRIIMKLLELRPQDRYQSVQELLHALSPFMTTKVVPQLAGAIQAYTATTVVLPTAPTKRVIYKKGNLSQGHSTMYDSPLTSPTRALADAATIVAIISLFFPWAFLEYEYGFLDLLRSSNKGYQFECWLTIIALFTLICLFFVKKRIASTRTALARWKMLLGITMIIPALDLILTQYLLPAGDRSARWGCWIMVSAGVAVVCASIGDIKSWWLPKAAREPGYAKIIHRVHLFTVIIVAICGIWTAYNGYLKSESYITALILGGVFVICTIASFKFDDGLHRAYKP